ncbi:MAG: hypothetical protein J1E62_07800 [Lachnospiraceae bacterium]|nr:hypothetical protein [Lachnospiraceae bacterium]
MDEDNENNKSRWFCISIYENWKPEGICGLLDKEAENAYAELIKNIVKNIIKGRKNVNRLHANGISSGGKGSVNRKRVNKDYIFEQLMTLATKYRDDSEFRHALEDIEKYAKLYKGDDKYYEELLDFINNFI